jgi:hypothetical protein
MKRMNLFIEGSEKDVFGSPAGSNLEFKGIKSERIL